MMAARQLAAKHPRIMLTHNETNELGAARLLSGLYRVGDLAEAVYTGPDGWLPRERTIWRVVGEIDELARLVPHPPPHDWPGDEYAALTLELAEVVKLGSILDV